MNSKTRSLNYQKNRNAEIEAKLQECISFLDKEEIKHKLFTKIISKYLPKINKIDDKLKEILNNRIEELTTVKIEEIIKENIEHIFINLTKEKLQEMIDEELDKRLSLLIKYNDEDY